MVDVKEARTGTREVFATHCRSTARIESLHFDYTIVVSHGHSTIMLTLMLMLVLTLVLTPKLVQVEVYVPV